MSKKFKIGIATISFMLIASIGTNIYLGLNNYKLNKKNNEIQSQLNEMKSEENIGVNQKENQETAEIEDNSANNKASTSTNANKQQIESPTDTINNERTTQSNHPEDSIIGVWYMNAREGFCAMKFEFTADGKLYVDDKYLSDYANGVAFCYNCNSIENNNIKIEYNFNGGELYTNFIRFRERVYNHETGESNYTDNCGNYQWTTASQKLHK